MLQVEFQRMQKEFGFEIINANLRIDTIQRELRKKIGGELGIGATAQALTPATPAPPAEEPQPEPPQVPLAAAPEPPKRRATPRPRRR
jgi:hypothetical protein